MGLILVGIRFDSRRRQRHRSADRRQNNSRKVTIVAGHLDGRIRIKIVSRLHFSSPTLMTKLERLNMRQSYWQHDLIAPFTGLVMFDTYRDAMNDLTPTIIIPVRCHLPHPPSCTTRFLIVLHSIRIVFEWVRQRHSNQPHSHIHFPNARLTLGPARSPFNITTVIQSIQDGRLPLESRLHCHRRTG